MTTKTRFRLWFAAALVAVAGLALAGCTYSNATTKDQKAVDTQLNTFEQTQPIPFNNWSQYRQTVIDVEQAQIHGVATTTFFYNMGSNVPIKSCPSIGFPVAATAQLTNPSQVAFGGNTNGNQGDYGVIGQQEPNGVYSGDTSGTYVVCVQPDGTNQIDYWEGYVDAEGGPAHFDKTTGTIVSDGSSSVTSKTKH